MSDDVRADAEQEPAPDDLDVDVVEDLEVGGEGDAEQVRGGQAGYTGGCRLA
jgi:hypothetical protein